MMQEKIVKLLEENARLSDREIAVMLGISEAEAAAAVAELEKTGVIKGYHAVVDWDRIDPTHVTGSVVSLYENEMRQPSPEIIIALARLYGVTTDYLLCGNRRSFVDVSGLNEQEIAAIVNMVGLLRSKK